MRACVRDRRERQVVKAVLWSTNNRESTQQQQAQTRRMSRAIPLQKPQGWIAALNAKLPAGPVAHKQG